MNVALVGREASRRPPYLLTGANLQLFLRER